jgi:hypothetical protein
VNALGGFFAADFSEDDENGVGWAPFVSGGQEDDEREEDEDGEHGDDADPEKTPGVDGGEIQIFIHHGGS